MRALPPRGPGRVRYYGVRRKLLEMRDESERLSRELAREDVEVGMWDVVQRVVGGVVVTCRWNEGWVFAGGVTRCCRTAALDLMEISDARRGV